MTLNQTFAQIEHLIPGIQAAILMGHDGIPVVQNVFSEELDITELVLECSAILQNAQRIFENFGLEELVVKSKKGFFTMVPLDDEYYIFIVVELGGLQGKARYAVQKFLPQLRAQL